MPPPNAPHVASDLISNVLGPSFTFGTAPPTTGRHNVGDFVWDTTPAETGAANSKYVIVGWTCTVAGTPGTWLAARALTGN